MKFAVLLLIAAAGVLKPQEISRTTRPKAMHSPQPEYTKEALGAKLQGVVALSFLVGIDGAVSDIKVIKGLGYGLNEKAIECLNRWQLSPGTKDGEPTPMYATAEINFRLPQSPTKPPDSK
jgi:TonB family protein